MTTVLLPPAPPDPPAPPPGWEPPPGSGLPPSGPPPPRPASTFARWALPATVVGSGLVAFHRSLLSLLEGLRLDTPLSHLGLVPAMALAVAWMRHRRRHDLDIHDRQLDWIIGLPLIAAAVIANLVLPARMSTDFWTWRLDMVTLPVFVAGAAALLLGVRALAGILPAIGLLFLAWPWPYRFALDRWLDAFTEVTVLALRGIVEVVPVAVASRPTGGLFFVEHAGERIEMSVAAACAGANSLVGFLLVGTALLAVVKGPAGRKAAWLVTGAALVWAMNVLRIVGLFAAARAWGRGVAIDGLHPFVGLVAFALGVGAMVLLAPRFGLTLGPVTPPDGDEARGRLRPMASGPAPRGSRPAVAVVVVSALILAAANVGVARAEATSNPFGAPRLTAFSVDDEAPPGWQVERVTEYDWTKQFFGRDSTWTRYGYLYAGPGPLNSNLPVIADVVDTGSRSSLVAYGVKECYRFHDYDVVDERSASMGSGVVGRILTFRPTEDSTWTTLHWQWPVRSGGRNRYERVTLLVIDAQVGQFEVPGDPSRQDPQLEVADMLRGAERSDVSPRLEQTQDFLVAFGRQIVAARPAASG